jgi:hypothetical protein
MTETIGMVLDRIEKEQANVLHIGPNGTSLDLLQAVYRNPTIPLPTRMRAAGLALPHEHPRLAVTAQITENDFATLLEGRIKNFERIANGGAKPLMIEAKPVPQMVEARPIKPHVIDRRYRRV